MRVYHNLCTNVKQKLRWQKNINYKYINYFEFKCWSCCIACQMREWIDNCTFSPDLMLQLMPFSVNSSPSL